MPDLTQERLKELLHYDPETGVFTRLVSISSNARAGAVAGAPTSDGYLSIKIDGKRHKAHRLAFYYMMGEWPAADVDHIDMNKVNNRWSNLLEATRSQNNANTRARSTNKLGIKGVSMHSKSHHHYGIYRPSQTQRRAYLRLRHRNARACSMVGRLVARHRVWRIRKGRVMLAIDEPARDRASKSAALDRAAKILARLGGGNSHELLMSVTAAKKALHEAGMDFNDVADAVRALGADDAAPAKTKRKAGWASLKIGERFDMLRKLSGLELTDDEKWTLADFADKFALMPNRDTAPDMAAFLDGLMRIYSEGKG